MTLDELITAGEEGLVREPARLYRISLQLQKDLKPEIRAGLEADFDKVHGQLAARVGLKLANSYVAHLRPDVQHGS